MKIYSAQLKGTTTVATGSNVSLTGSFTGSIYGFNDTLQYSSSVDSRIVVNTNRLNNIESKSASVDISISNINSVTASNIARLSNLESKSASVDISISNINAVTASNIARLSNLETKSSSVDISITNINSFTASNGNTSLNQLTGSLATTGSNSFYGTQVFSGSVYIANDLVVQGSSSIQYISASSVSIGTNIVQLNTANPSVRFAGLTMIDSGSVGGSGSFLYDSLQDEFIFVHRGNGTNVTSSHFVTGPETYDSLGNETYLTCNVITKGTGKEHLVDSCIFDNGTTTCIKNNLIGTGTISGTTIYGSTTVCSTVGKFSTCIDVGSGTFTGGISIGTTNTTGKVSIQQTINDSGLYFFNCASGTRFMFNHYCGSGINSLIIQEFDASNTFCRNIMALTSGGNVGIGTATPTTTISANETTLQITNANVASVNLQSTGGRRYSLASLGAGGQFGIFDVNAGSYRLLITCTGALSVIAPNHMQFSIKSSTSGDASLQFGAEDNVIIGMNMYTAANDISWFIGRHRPGVSGITDEMNLYRGQVNLHRVQSNGNYSFAGSNVSDVRLKENIQIINYNATEKLLQLSPVSYNMIEHPTIHRSGFIAQEVKEVLPNFVTGNESENEYLGVDYNGILALTVKAMQEQQCTINTLKSCLGIN